MASFVVGPVMLGGSLCYDMSDCAVGGVVSCCVVGAHDWLWWWVFVAVMWFGVVLVVYGRHMRGEILLSGVKDALQCLSLDLQWVVWGYKFCS